MTDSALQEAISQYQDTMVKLSGELGSEAQQGAIATAQTLINNPYLSRGLKLTLAAKVQELTKPLGQPAETDKT